VTDAENDDSELGHLSGYDCRQPLDIYFDLSCSLEAILLADRCLWVSPYVFDLLRWFCGLRRGPPSPSQVDYTGPHRYVLAPCPPRPSSMYSVSCISQTAADSARPVYIMNAMAGEQSFMNSPSRRCCLYRPVPHTSMNTGPTTIVAIDVSRAAISATWASLRICVNCPGGGKTPRNSSRQRRRRAGREVWHRRMNGPMLYDWPNQCYDLRVVRVACTCAARLQTSGHARFLRSAELEDAASRRKTTSVLQSKTQ